MQKHKIIVNKEHAPGQPHTINTVMRANVFCYQIWRRIDVTEIAIFYDLQTAIDVCGFLNAGAL